MSCAKRVAGPTNRTDGQTVLAEQVGLRLPTGQSRGWQTALLDKLAVAP